MLWLASNLVLLRYLVLRFPFQNPRYHPVRVPHSLARSSQTPARPPNRDFHGFQCYAFIILCHQQNPAIYVIRKFVIQISYYFTRIAVRTFLEVVRFEVMQEPSRDRCGRQNLTNGRRRAWFCMYPRCRWARSFLGIFGRCVGWANRPAWVYAWGWGTIGSTTKK